MEFDLTRGDSSSEEGSDSETDAWWGGSQLCGEDDCDPEIAVSSHVEVCPAPDHAVDCGRHAISVSPATDPPIPIARVHVAVRCSQATTVGGGSPNSLDDAMDAETRPVTQPQCAAHHDSPEMEEERREDVDILPRPSRRLVLLGAGSLGSHNRFSPLADEDEPMDVADHDGADVVHDEGSEVSVDEETRTAHSPRS